MPLDRIWGLLDDRVGHARQVQGLLRALGGGREIALGYRHELRLPDLLAPATIGHLDAATTGVLAGPVPRVAIGCGRRTAAVLRWLKRRAGDAILTVYLMRPARLSGIDLAIVPAHDRPASDSRIITTLGALHPSDRRALDAALDELPDECRALPRPRIALLVGGPAKRATFSAADLDRLAAAVDGLAQQLGGSVLATTSRRTPAGFAERLGAALAVPHSVYDAGSEAANPFRAFLGSADRVVVTSDSASMLSEACAAGRPVHVWPMAGTPPKLQSFADALAAGGYVQPWTESATQPPAPLDEAARIGGLVRDRLVT